MVRTKSSTGFTLIELMITITLLAIFVAIAVPSFTSFINNNRVQSASNELASLLQYARSTAVQNNSTYIVCLSGDQWTVRKRGPTATPCSISALRSMGTPIGVSFTASGNAFPLAFNSNGTAANAAALITCHDTESANGYKITVQNSGSIRVWNRGQDESGSSLSSCTP